MNIDSLKKLSGEEKRKFMKNNILKFSEDDMIRILSSVDFNIDFFVDYIPNNEILFNSKKLINFIINNYNNFEACYIFDKFSTSLFDDETIDIIISKKCPVNMSDVILVPNLLNNKKINKTFFQKVSYIISNLDVNEITKPLVTILENKKYPLTEEQLFKSPLFLESDSLVCSSLKKYPNIITKLTTLNNEKIRIALDNGFVPKKADFLENLSLINFKYLIDDVFKIDPSVIVFYDEVSIREKTAIALKNGYTPIEEDLKLYQNLRKESNIMQAAIVQNSSLIKYISKECYIPNELIDLALTNYKITNNDVQFNPDLLNHPRIVESLLHSNNDYEKLIKVLMKQQLLQKFNQFNNDLDISGLENINIPNISKEVFLEFINSYYFKLDEKNVDVQENYFNMLNDVIDGIVNIKYHSSKNKLKYPDILTLHNEMIELFNNDNYEKAEEEVIFAIYDFTGKAINRNDIKSQITILKNYYIENQKLDENVTDKFFNNILNLNRNSFMKFEIRKLHIEIIPKLKLTEKKKQLLVNGKKLKKITDAIENNNLSSLGITDKQFDDQIKTVCYNILNNKKLNKDIQYDSIHNNLKNLAIYYRNTGELSREDTSKILGIDSVKNTDIITKQFNNINYELLKRAKFLDSENVVLDIEKNSIEGINYNNFKIANNKKYLENLIEYLLSSNDHEIKKVLNSNSSIKQIFGMLPIVNLFQEFNLETFKNIVDNFELIMSKINDKKDNFIWKNIDEIILLAESYAAIDEIEVGILGKETIEYIDNKYLPEYISLYKEMLKREYGNIPPVNFATPKYKAASGKFSDSQRLIIGKKPFQKSCMCLENISGKETFIELLTSKNADVVLLNDNNNNLISRVFLFRRGNVLQMVSNAYDNVPLEVYLEISRQIIQQSIDTNDNLDYIFLNDFHLSRKMGQYITIEDERLLSDFPHADFHNFAALINSKEEVLYYSPDTVKLDFKIEPKVEYLKARNKINYNPSDKDINKLRAVYYSLHDNKSKVIEPFVISEYKSVVCGDDWYIAQRFDGSIEELFTSNDFRAHEEYLIVRKSSLNKDYQRIK